MPSYDGRYDKELKLFTDAMKTKLASNAHKGRWESLDLGKAFDLLRKEVDELEEAISRGNSVEILLESADIGNFALIICDVAMKEAINGKA
jgi:hypothetical protein